MVQAKDYTEIQISELARHLHDPRGRLRTSSPEVIFDNKQLADNAPLIFDDQETSGTGTDSSYDTNQSASTLSVSANIAGTRVRQTFRRFNYQPGKSLLAIFTGILGSSESGITRRIGYFDENNGIFFHGKNDGTMNVTLRSNVSGSVVDDDVEQSNWNIDKMDGSGPSGLTLNLNKAQIFFIDFDWLGVGDVALGVIVDRGVYHVHEFHNGNKNTNVYMSTPNLPLRYELSNDGTGGAATLKHICTSVVTEGGQNKLGVNRYKSTSGTHVDANVANTIYAVVGIRLKSTHLDYTVEINDVSLINQANDDFEWLLIWNPTVAGSPSWANETNGAVQTFVGATANTVTGGTIIDGGIVKAGNNSGTVDKEVDNALILGSALDGTPDEIILCARPLSVNADIEGSVNFRELS